MVAMKNQVGPFFVRITLVDATRGVCYGGYPPGNSFGPYRDTRSLFAAMKEEWGGVVRKVFRDTPAGVAHVGWTFTSRQKYDDCKDRYTREAWVEVVREVSPARDAVWETVSIGGG